MARILIIEDEQSIRNVLRNILKDENANYQVDEAANGKEGVEMLRKEAYDLIMSDIKMPGLDGIEVLERARTLSPDSAIVMISGHGDIDTAVECIKKGAFDYIPKPPDLNRLLNTVRLALDRISLVEENKRLKRKVSKRYEMIGKSKLIQDIREMIEKVASTDARVMITGPNGTGKELVAHQIHEKSDRSKGPMVEVNCAAIPAELIESELFGHEKGAFTSAVKQRKGKFELAQGGTLFMDEIGDMSLGAQSKVLRTLQENKITRVGGDKEIKVDVRVIAATNKDLTEEIREGRFREDLYHRLSVILIKVPSLNDRAGDISLLANYFLGQIAQEQGTAKKTFVPQALEALKNINWTGNIRELRNVVERLTILCGQEITEQDVRLYASK